MQHLEVRRAWLAGFAGATAFLIGACSGQVGQSGPIDRDGDGIPDDPGTGGNSGTGGGGEPGTGGNPTLPVEFDPTFTCDANAVPAPAPLRRLTATQYRATLDAMVRFATNDAAATAQIMRDLAPAFTRLPADARASVPQDLEGSYRRMDQTLAQVQVDSYYELAGLVGAALTTSTRLGPLLGACATDASTSNDSTCIDQFIDRFGARALRRPLSAADRTFYRRAYEPSTGIDGAGVAAIIALLLNAPAFVYQLEAGEAAVAGQNGVFSLTPFETAARLAYQFWDAPPDDALWTAASSGALATDASYAAQVDRVFADPRTQSTLQRFYEDWLKVDALPKLDVNNSQARFKAFAGAALPSATLHDAMKEDAVALATHHTFTEPGGFGDLMRSDLSFARTGELAKLYGVPQYTGTGAPPAFPAGTRPGLLTRAAFLASETGVTRPIMRGVFLRRNILCDVIPPPPDDAAGSPPEVSLEQSTRQVVEQLTETEGTKCVSCHGSFINHLGFALEGYDALGRARSEQTLLDPAGAEVKRVPIDTLTTPHVVFDDERTVGGPGELADRIVESGKGEACLSRAYFRFSFARWDDPEGDKDGCLLERLRGALADGGKLTAMFRELALAPEFRHRTYLP